MGQLINKSFLRATSCTSEKSKPFYRHMSINTRSREGKIIQKRGSVQLINKSINVTQNTSAQSFFILKQGYKFRLKVKSPSGPYKHNYPYQIEKKQTYHNISHNTTQLNIRRSSAHCYGRIFKYFNVQIQSVSNTLYKQNQNLFKKFYLDVSHSCKHCGIPNWAKHLVTEMV